MNNQNKPRGKSKPMTAFLVGASLVVVYLILSGLSDIAGVIFNIIGPILTGAFITVLLNPVLVWFTSRFSSLFGRSKKLSERTKHKLTKVLSITCTILFGLFFIAALFLMIIPEAINSILTLANEASSYIDHFTEWLKTLPWDDNVISETLDKIVLEVISAAEAWITTDLPKTLDTVVNVAVSGVSIVFNSFVSFIVVIYLMKDKEKFVAGSKRIIYAIFSRDTANSVVSTARHGYKIFGSFLSGKIIDSAIIGLLCFIFMSIFGMRYSLLISCIIGISNIIPLFGPYIGGAFSTFFLLIIDPRMALGFLVLVIVLQTFDGNILGPLILGQKTGLSEFWITFALLFFGGLFGLFGMIIGIPLLAVIFYVLDGLVNRALIKKDLPTDSKTYLHSDLLTEDGFTTLDEKPVKAIVSIKNIKNSRKNNEQSNDDEL